MLDPGLQDLHNYLQSSTCPETLLSGTSHPVTQRAYMIRQNIHDWYQHVMRHDDIMSVNNLPPEINSQISLREEYDDWALLFDPDTGNTVGLTPTGVTIWKCLLEKKDMPEIILALSKEFEDVPDDLDSDIRSFFDQIINLGFAKRTN